MIEPPIEARAGNDRLDERDEAAPPIREKTILVVDDESEIAEVLGQILEVDGHRVDLATNGADASSASRGGSTTSSSATFACR